MFSMVLYYSTPLLVKKHQQRRNSAENHIAERGQRTSKTSQNEEFHLSFFIIIGTVVNVES